MTSTSRQPTSADGGVYRKATCLWHPFGRFQIRCAYKCHHFPNGRPRPGRVSHPYTIGGQTSRALKGADEKNHRNRIPVRLLRYLLTLTRKGTWFLDLCSGYQTNRQVAEEAGLTYIAVDVNEFFKLGSGPNAATAQAHIVADLIETDPEALLSEIWEKKGSPQRTWRSSGSHLPVRRTRSCNE